MLETLTYALFAEHLGSKFRLHAAPGRPVEVELVEATPLRSHSRPGRQGPRREPFSIVFRGPKDHHLPQKIYTLEHEQMGALSLFLVPIEPDAEGPLFEAVFN
jgi:hypothetical protein